MSEKYIWGPIWVRHFLNNRRWGNYINPSPPEVSHRSKEPLFISYLLGAQSETIFAPFAFNCADALFTSTWLFDL